MAKMVLLVSGRRAMAMSGWNGTTQWDQCLGRIDGHYGATHGEIVLYIVAHLGARRRGVSDWE